MTAQLIKRDGDDITLQITINLRGSLLEAEETIQDAVNEIGCLATQEALKRFDADGAPIVLGDVIWTHKMTNPKPYQTPYGEERHLYQTAKGGKSYCPLEHNARIIRHATPRFAKQLAHKYAEMNVNRVCHDLLDNHGRKIAASYVQNVADWVGSIACATEEDWDDEPPAFDRAVSTVVLSLDGAHLPIKDEGYKQAMVGTISLYTGDKSVYIQCTEAPESGKATFIKRVRSNASKPSIPMHSISALLMVQQTTGHFLNNTLMNNCWIMIMRLNTSRTLHKPLIRARQANPSASSGLLTINATSKTSRNSLTNCSKPHDGSVTRPA